MVDKQFFKSKYKQFLYDNNLKEHYGNFLSFLEDLSIEELSALVCMYSNTDRFYIKLNTEFNLRECFVSLQDFGQAVCRYKKDDKYFSVDNGELYSSNDKLNLVGVAWELHDYLRESEE